jgi:hypothetical protein
MSEPQTIKNVVGAVLETHPIRVVEFGQHKIIVGQANGQVAATRKKIAEWLTLGRMVPASRDADGVLWADDENCLDPRLEQLTYSTYADVTWLCSSERFDAADSHSVPTIFAAFMGTSVVAFFAPVSSPAEKLLQQARRTNS